MEAVTDTYAVLQSTPVKLIIVGINLKLVLRYLTSTSSKRKNLLVGPFFKYCNSIFF